MNTPLDSGTQVLIGLLKLSQVAEVLLKAIQSLPTIRHHASCLGGIKSIRVTAVPQVDLPTARVEVIGENDGTIKLYCCMRTSYDKLTLIECDLPNVQRCSTDLEVRQNAGHSC